jgi:protein tyrosine/serine phosphatase
MESTAKPAGLVRSRRKLLSDMEDDDIQNLSNEEINRSEISDSVDVLKGSENENKENITKNGCKVTA